MFGKNISNRLLFAFHACPALLSKSVVFLIVILILLRIHILHGFEESLKVFVFVTFPLSGKHQTKVHANMILVIAENCGGVRIYLFYTIIVVKTLLHVIFHLRPDYCCQVGVKLRLLSV